MIQLLKSNFIELLISSGLSQYWSNFIAILALVFTVLVIAYLIDKVARYILFTVFIRLVKKSKTDWDDLLVEHKVFYAFAHLVPVMFIFYVIPELLDQELIWVDYLERLSKTIFIIVFLILFFRILNVVKTIVSRIESLKDKPLDSFFQLAKIIISIILTLIILSILAKTKITFFFGAFGAMTAVVILVFKDTLLGFIGSIQLSANDMIRVGDWISMEKFGADGDVIEINLTTVKVKNWDKTITTVPTYSLISDSFKNWRGMQETGSRRIARSIFVNQSTVKFADQKLIEKFKKIHLLKDYIPNKENDILAYNQENNIDTSLISNGRRITNIGTFRAYLVNYLKNHPKINQDLTILVRQLDPTTNGIPLQIYAFSNDIEWISYEGIQSDIFDHILAVISQFELSLFQSPSGADFKKAIG
ncbi:MAG: mechanosensitive ion channel [Vicingaceae bacterium]